MLDLKLPVAHVFLHRTLELPESVYSLHYPGVHSFRAGRLAAKMAYDRIGIKNPEKEIDFAELYDAYTSAEIQAYEDMGFCPMAKEANL